MSKNLKIFHIFLLIFLEQVLAGSKKGFFKKRKSKTENSNEALNSNSYDSKILLNKPESILETDTIPESLSKFNDNFSRSETKDSKNSKLESIPECENENNIEIQFGDVDFKNLCGKNSKHKEDLSNNLKFNKVEDLIAECLQTIHESDARSENEANNNEEKMFSYKPDEFPSLSQKINHEKSAIPSSILNPINSGFEIPEISNSSDSDSSISIVATSFPICDLNNSTTHNLLGEIVSNSVLGPKISKNIIPPVKNHLNDYLKTEDCVFDDQNQSVSLAIDVIQEISTKNDTAKTSVLQKALEKLNEIKNIEKKIDSFIEKFNSKEFSDLSYLKSYISDKIYNCRISHIQNSFLPFNIDINEYEINKYDAKNERKLSIAESELKVNDANNFRITPFSLNSIDYTQIFQVETIFNSLKDFMISNKDCNRNLNVNNFLTAWIYLEKMMKSSFNKADIFSFANYKSAKNDFKESESSDPTDNLFDIISNENNNEPIDYVFAQKDSLCRNKDVNDYVLIDNDSGNNESDDIIVLNSTSQNSEYLLGKHTFLYYIQYLVEFIEFNFVFDRDDIHHEYSMRTMFLKFIKVTTIIYEALYGDMIVLDRVSTNCCGKFDQIIKNDPKIINLSKKLENELLNFVLSYRYIYKRYYIQYLKQYSDDPNAAVEMFRITTVLLDTIMNMMIVICNFRKIYLNDKIKSYSLDYNFIESSPKLVFKHFDNTNTFANNTCTNDTGIIQFDTDSYTIFKNLLVSFAKLNQLPVNFIKRNELKIDKFDMANFENIITRFIETNGYEDLSSTDRNKKILEFLNSANVFISKHLNLGNYCILGSGVWIEKYAIALYKQMKKNRKVDSCVCQSTIIDLFGLD